LNAAVGILAAFRFPAVTHDRLQPVPILFGTAVAGK
jgi:hypothetical protein